MAASSRQTGKGPVIQDSLAYAIGTESKRPPMVSECMRALEQFPLNRSLNAFRWHGNPILEKGAPGEWDEALIRDPMVFYDYLAPAQERFKLYYSGEDTNGHMHIGLAYGSSLEHLTRCPANPIIRMTEDWENMRTNHNPYVIRLPGTGSYEMLYTARACDQNGRSSFSTGRVTSCDGQSWVNKKQVFTGFQMGGRTYFPQKPILHYNVEESTYYLIFAASLMERKGQKNEGFTGLATSVNGEEYAFERIIIPQDMAGSIYDPHGLVPLLGWYFLLITHDSAYPYDPDGNSNWPERWLVSRDLRNWYGCPKSVWDTYPDEGFLYSHVSPLVTESGWAYFVYDYGKPNRFCLAKVPLVGKPYNVVVDCPFIRPEGSTELRDCYPALCLQPGDTLALTVECTYQAEASRPAQVHVYTSYDGENWDTEEQRNASGRPIFGDLALRPGNALRQTTSLHIGARFIKATVENPDPNQLIRDVKVVATFGA